MTFAAMEKRKSIRISKSRVEYMAYNDTIQRIFKEVIYYENNRRNYESDWV